MANATKIVARMKSNPRDWRIEDLKVVARHFEITWRQHGTSHVIFSKGPKTVPVPVAKPILPLYVKAFLKLLEVE
jgi:hypothetical protein